MGHSSGTETGEWRYALCLGRETGALLPESLQEGTFASAQKMGKGSHILVLK